MKQGLILIALVVMLLGAAWSWFSNRQAEQQLSPSVQVQDLQLPDLGNAGYDWIAKGIFKNETGGQVDKLTYWGEGEDFPSMGIGHFIWFPEGVDAPFDEQFPSMVAYVAKAVDDDIPMPAWLRELEPFDAPWPNKQQFDEDWSSAELSELRQWLSDTRLYQARYIVSAFRQRWQDLELPAEQKQGYNQLLQKLMASREGLFAVIDYYNFKGLGINPRERYQGQGWGLLQVLQTMLETPVEPGACVDQLQRFSTAAADRLSLRVQLAPPERNEARWLAGWLKRLGGYLHDASMARRVSGCGFRIKPYLQNPAVDAMTINWLSNQAQRGQLKIRKMGGPPAGTEVLFESSPVQADALGYHPEENCAEDYCSDVDLPYLHQVRITDLQAGGSYEYEVLQGADRSSGSFSTVDPETDSVRFIVYADSETEPESTGKHAHWPGIDASSILRMYPLDQTTGYANNLDVIRSRNPDFVAIAGDMVQSGGEQRDWDEFWRHNEALAANTAILPALGNHDYFGGPGELGKYGTEDSERSVLKYLTYFDLPDNGAANQTHTERYYAMQYGPLSLIVLDPTDGLPHRSDRDTNWRLRGENDGGNAPDWHQGSEQYQWLEQQLVKAQQNSAFTFVMFHSAPYTSGVHGQPPGENPGEDILSSMPLKALTPLFMRYGVDAVFSGHDEMYEHSVVAGIETTGDGRTFDQLIHFLDVGIGGDGLRGPAENVQNLERVFLAHTDSPEIYDQNGVLIDGGKHYGHLEVNISKSEDGQWQAKLEPVYVFPLMGEDQLSIGFERRLYDDVISIQARNLE